jgi:cell division protein FtsB
MSEVTISSGSAAWKEKQMLTFMRSRNVLIANLSFFLLWFMGCAAMTGKPSLVDFDTVSPQLELTSQQKTEIEPKVKEIKAIVEEYESERDELIAEVAEQRETWQGTSASTGEEREERRQRFRNSPLRRKFQQLRSKREKNQKRIDALVASIRETLTDEQNQKLGTEIQLPVLESEQREGRGGGQMGERRGGQRRRRNQEE